MNVLLLQAWLTEATPALLGTRLREVRQLDAKTLALQLTGVGAAQPREGVGADLASARSPGGDKPSPYAQSTLWLIVSILEISPLLALVPPDSPLLDAEHPDSGFAKALRHQLSGASLERIEQEGFDRSVCFEFLHRDIYGRESRRTLRVELVGRASNAYLISDRGMVVSIFKRVPPGRNSVRRIVTGKPLPPPPPLDKYIAASGSAAALAAELESAGSVRELLTRRVAASDVSLWAALEPLVPPTTDAAELQNFVTRLQTGELTAALFGLAAGRSASDVAVALWQAAKEAQGGPGNKAAAAPARVDQEQHRRAEIESQLELARHAEELEQLALAMQHDANSVPNRDAEAAYLRDWAAQQPRWAERLDPAASLHDNASALIRFSQRLRRARPGLEELLSKSAQQSDSVGADLASARDGSAGSPAGQSAATEGRPTVADPLANDMRKLKRGDVKYLRFVTSEGVHMLVGQTDRSNDELVRLYGSSRHLWLHVRDYPGSHVVLLTGGREPSQRSLQEAAVVAGYFSQGRGEIELEVSYLPLKHLRRPKGGRPGQVLKTTEKVIRVRPDAFEELRAAMQWNG